ncbi:hypothetical protein VdG1_04175 [Verticillium dahliae VDG1]|nr:hypothetical protein VdG1_04175 [Verticillium dahliae VDG1]
MHAPPGAGALGFFLRNGHTWSRRRTAKPELSNFAPGHGEQIWVWHHLTSHQIIYSHTPQLDSNHALKQLPFIAKKSTPAKLRKDLWRPMALIQFPAGAGTAGQSAFQKLREYRRRHELEQLLEATVFWRDQQDKNFASEWSANVKHELFEDAKALQGAEAAEVEQVVDAATPVAKEA